MEDNQVIEERKKRIIELFRKRVDWIAYAILGVIIAVSCWIRLQPIRINPASGKPGLWDISTNNWTLGPDLDPFLFLRWAKYIVENGSLYVIDTMRYAPLGFNTKQELVLLPNMMAWFHQLASIFGVHTVELSAILFPVFMFAIALPFFFLFCNQIFKKIFDKKLAYVGALVATLLLVIQPTLLPRTIAGIPEKEAASLVFYFAALYFFVQSMDAKNLKKSVVFATLAGIATAGMTLVWGGYIYLFVVIALTMMIMTSLEKVSREGFIGYCIWLALGVGIPLIASQRQTLGSYISSTTTGLAFFVLAFSAVNLIVGSDKLKNFRERYKLSSLPVPVISLAITIIAGIVAGSLIFGASFVPDKFSDATRLLIKPTTDRIGVTVAENKQPYLTEWVDGFGPFIPNTHIAILLWIFIIGTVMLVAYESRKMPKKERIYVVASFFILICAIIFTRYSEQSIFDGQSFLSSASLVGSIILFASAILIIYYSQKKRSSFEYKEINYGSIVAISLCIVSLLAARSAIRLVMMLSIPVAIGAALAVIFSYRFVFKGNHEKKVVPAAIFIILLLGMAFSGWILYNSSLSTAKTYVPSVYTQQWQLAMGWIRENTPQESVFAHWWDYGYWVQSMGKRATILDGGNAISYWNYLMARNVLTSVDDKQALDFLYTHNATHLLIDSTDIGKYPAFSSIGSDENYDRYSWISTFLLDPSQTIEKKNSTTRVYRGQFVLDEDISIYENGTRIFLPGGQSALLAIVIEGDRNNNSGEPYGLFAYKNSQYKIYLRDIGANALVIPRLVQGSQGLQIMGDGAMIYLSNRTSNSNIARLYILNQVNPNYRLVHSEDDLIVSQIKSQSLTTSDFIMFDGLRGPIRIWEIRYPSDVSYKDEYLQKKFPVKI